MNLDYTTDDSFFTTVIPPFSLQGWAVKSWLLSDEIAKFRFIRDIELEREFWNLKMINEVYTGIKTIGLVMNPFRRMVYAFKSLSELPENNIYKFNTKILNLDTFDKFLISWSSLDSAEPFWFKFSTPLHDWMFDGNVYVDYLLRVESLEKDFKPLNNYFKNYSGFVGLNDLFDYESYYNSESKKIVEKIFEKDLDEFKYHF